MMVSRRVATLGGLLGVSLLAGRAQFAYAYDGVLGTSLDMRVVAVDAAAADAARDAALAEVERLEGILSAYSPTAELARANAGARVRASAELIEVLALYDAWGARTGGAISNGTAQTKALWREVAKGRELSEEELSRAVANTQARRWRVESGALVVDSPLNVDALGKAYVVQRAAEKARAVAGVTGGVLDIGGDLVTWGCDADGKPWRVGVADPHNPAENARPLSVLEVNDAAIATSGGYARGGTVDGNWRSHIVDPRTGKVAGEIVSATVVAQDLVTANAVSTAMNVGSRTEAMDLATKTGVAAMVVTRERAVGRNTQFIAAEAAPTTRTADEAPAKWPTGFQVSVSIDLPAGGGRRRPERPCTVVWIEDAKGKHVRTIELWGGVGKDAKYNRDMKSWWKWAKDDPQMVRAVTRASRNPGQYTMVWDGKDQKGNPVPTGTYTVWIEVASEHGARAASSGKIVCGADQATGTVAKTAAFGASMLTYASKEKTK